MLSIDFGQALTTLGELLESRGVLCEVVVIGGGALALQGHIVRSTKDLDIVAIIRGGHLESAKQLPPELVKARDDVAAALGLPKDWLNAGPTSLLDLGLPDGFEERLVTQRYQGLTLHLAGRFDQVCFKFYAAVDQGPRSKHVDDLRRLQPSPQELLAAARWARGHDPSEGFLTMSRQTLAHFGVIEDHVDL